MSDNSNKRIGRGRLVADLVLRDQCNEVRGYPDIGEDPEFGATRELAYARDREGKTFNYVNTLPSGLLAVRVTLRGKNVVFGYFTPEKFMTALRYADMIAVRIWKYRRRDASPPHDGRLNFGSTALAEKDWERYAGTYGASIVKIFTRLEAMNIISDDQERYYTPRENSEKAMESFKEMLIAFRRAWSEREAAFDSMVGMMNRRLAGIEEKLAVFTRSVPALESRGVHAPDVVEVPLGDETDPNKMNVPPSDPWA